MISLGQRVYIRECIRFMKNILWWSSVWKTKVVDKSLPDCNGPERAEDFTVIQSARICTLLCGSRTQKRSPRFPVSPSGAWSRPRKPVAAP